MNGIVWSPDSKYLLTCSHDKEIKCFDGKTGELVKKFCKHTDPVYGIGWLPNSKKFISSSIDSHLRFWDLDEGEKWNMKIFRSTGLAILKSGLFAYVVSGSQGLVTKVSLTEKRRVKELKENDQICSITISKN